MSTIVSVFYDRTFQVVPPGGALNSIHKENMIRIQDKVVHKTRGVADLSGALNLVWEHPSAINSDGMTFCDSQASRKGKERFDSITSNTNQAAHSS